MAKGTWINSEAALQTTVSLVLVTMQTLWWVNEAVGSHDNK